MTSGKMYEWFPMAAVGVAVNSAVDVLVAGVAPLLEAAGRSAVLGSRKPVPQMLLVKSSSAKARMQDGEQHLSHAWLPEFR